MAISFIGSATGTNTATMPAHQAGDLIVVVAFRFGSTTAPTLAAGYTQISAGATGANPNSSARIIAFKKAASSSEVVGTWTNSEYLAVHVYRGADRISSWVANGGGPATTVNYPAVGIADNSDWIMAVGVANSTTTAVESPPAGTVLRSSAVIGTSEIASFDTDGSAGNSWTAKNVALGSSVLFGSAIVEIRASPLAITAQPGSYSVNGADTPIFDPAASTVTFIGAASGTNTATIPAHQPGDMLVLASVNNAANTNTPQTPTGWNSARGIGDSGVSQRVAWKIATSSGETLGTLTDTTELMVFVYRNVKAVSYRGGYPSTTATSVTYGNVVPSNITGTSKLLLGAFVRSLSSTVETPPSTTQLLINNASATIEYAAFETIGGFTNWAARAVPLGLSAKHVPFHLELIPPVNTNMLAEPGSYSISGADTPFVRSYTISSAPGSYMITGADTAFVRSLLMSADPAAYAVTSSPVTLQRGFFIFGDPASYAVSGANVPFVRSLKMNVDPASYAVTGADVDLFRRSVSLEAASYTVNSVSVNLVRGSTIFADPTSYTVTGANVPFVQVVNSIRLQRYVGGVWETNRLKQYKDGQWIKPNIKRYVSGQWEMVY